MSDAVGGIDKSVNPLTTFLGAAVLGGSDCSSQSSLCVLCGYTSSHVRAVAELSGCQASVRESNPGWAALLCYAPQGYPPTLDYTRGVKRWRAKELRNECFQTDFPVLSTPCVFLSSLLRSFFSCSDSSTLTGIWFDFREMFILLSKYPVITLGMELNVLLVSTAQVTMPPMARCCVTAHKIQTKSLFLKCLGCVVGCLIFFD